MRTFSYIITSLCLLLLIACNSNDTNLIDASIKNEVETVVCSFDTTQSYEIYLPSCYSKEKKLPVILCFDPHARGHLPVNLLKESAEKYRYIIAGSNNSKNNQTNSKYVTDVFYSDVMNKYSIDKNRIYCLGFSGGGRVASNIALQNSSIKGVISCAAGLSLPKNFTLKHEINFYGIVGNEDFNYQELVNLRNSPNLPNLNIQVQLFNGEHDWPPSEYLEEAILWMEFNAMRDKQIKKNKTQINKFFLKTDSLIRNEIKKKNYYHAYRLSKKGLSFLKDLKGTSIFDEYQKEITNKTEYKKQVKHIEKLYKTEFSLRNRLAKDFVDKDVDWWKETIKSLEETIERSNDNETSLMISRELNYLSMVSYIYTNQALNSNDMINSNKYLTLYEMLDPTNKDMHYFKAVYFSKTNQLDSAKARYNKAIKCGFDDIEKAKQELSFIE